ncbi:LysR family transcriptional regulator [Pectinatus frisingensis]|uniref:LysR family transcriptional regulator n=1 Tax=Pectinatus frisingensis TaxID=865 RepID=UPI0018C6E605|nr:LysR family transcriptional regulator [Pectinatus frisingensis]
MEIKQLYYFKAIAETENISKTSRKLYVAQPFLSRIIKELESELNIALFDRAGRSIHLNSNGKILLHYATEILQLQEKALDDLKKNNQVIQNSINIMMLNSTRIFPKLIVSFSNCHPDVRIVLLKFSSVTSIPENCDIVIHAFEQLAQKLKSVVLFEEECLLGMSRQHYLARIPKITVNILKNETFLLLTQENTLGDLTRRYFLPLKIIPKVPLQCDNQQTLTALVEEGMGLAFFPNKTWKVESDKILLRRIEGQKLKRNIFLSVTSQKPSRAVKTFYDFFINQSKRISDDDLA